MTGRNWWIVFHHSVEELKQGTKKSRFISNTKNQFHFFSQTQIAASLNRQNLWLLLNAWKALPFLNLSEIKAW
ncbi:hypothetical protein DB41_JX00010 [Neochlamydia sp. TUME1]|nr:hypothetical protein DB41_JX00010 [Neochlamydia sp. TUME1]